MERAKQRKEAAAIELKMAISSKERQEERDKSDDSGKEEEEVQR